jgi:peptide/nickel transport system substrate-binding protein
MRHPVVVFGAILTVLMVSCGPTPGPTQTSGASNDAPTTQNRTLTVAHRYEVNTLASKALQANGPISTTRLFNASLSLIDNDGRSRPYLVESLPQLNTDTWRVFPDGRMETTYVLRNNLTWQDGAPLTAEDFTFALRVYRDPNLATFTRTPQNQIEEILTPDARTLVVKWESPHPNGGSLTFEDIDPLPRHLIESMFTDYVEGRLSKDAFLGDRAWGTEYIGAGPYRLERWEAGVELQGRAFDGHVLGRPRIDRIIVRLFGDENQAFAAVLAGGHVDYTCCSTLRFPHLVMLKREWQPSGKGTAIGTSGQSIFLMLQQRPELVGHPALLNLQARRALAHGIDRPALIEGLFDGLGTAAETPVPPSLPFYPELDRLMTKYPLDPNRASQLMSDAGFAKDGEGLFVDRDRRRFHIDFHVQDGTEIERMQAILSDSWKQAGFEVRPVVVGRAQFSQLEMRHQLPGLGYALFPAQGEAAFRSSEVGTAANRWSGVNRSGWTHPEYDRLWETTNATLDWTERGRYVAQIMALVSEFLPGYPLYFSQGSRSWVANLQGPAEVDSAEFGASFRATTPYWNVQEWWFRA